jgi:hypothetical protein
MVCERGLEDELLGRVEDGLESRRRNVSRWHSGLTWKPAGLTQRIWVETAPSHAPADERRVHVRTSCVENFTGSHEQTAALAAAALENTISAVIRQSAGSSRLDLASTLLVRPDDVRRASHLIVAAAGLQSRDALRLSQSVAAVEAGLIQDICPEVTAGREMRDALLQDPLADRATPAAGGSEVCFETVARQLRAESGVRAAATRDGVTASLPWTGVPDDWRVILFEMRIDANTRLGSGLAVSLVLPAAAHFSQALALNDAEAGGDSQSDLLGGWMVRQGLLVHASFLPGHYCDQAVVERMAAAALGRAAWLRLSDVIDPPEQPPRRRLLRFPRGVP